MKDNSHFSSWVTARVVTLTRIYFTFLFGWAILHALFGDQWSLLFLINAFAPYLFAPLPAIIAIALTTRRHETWIELIAGIALAAFLYGGLFIPKFQNSTEPALTVMTYNMLGLNNQPKAVVRAIRAANADIVAIQELNPLAADAIRKELISEFPYQVLAPRWDVRGMGTISRFPIRVIGNGLPGEWVGAPQIFSLDWRGTAITLLNVHPAPTNVGMTDYYLAADHVEWTIRERERDIKVIANFCAAQSSPVIVLGDFNTTDQSDAYRIITRDLIDAWREAGWDLGHTFPAPDARGNSRLDFAGIALPTWLVRIDYVFHSRHWRTASAQIGQWDGVSDHRPVVARLGLK